MTNDAPVPAYELLTADAGALRDALPMEPGRVRSKRLLRTDALTVMGVAIDEGAVMREHVAAVPILIHVVEGRAALGLAEERIELPAGALIHVAADVRHSVEGLAPTRFLLLMLGGAAR